MQQYGIFIAVIGKNAVFFFIAVKVGKPLGVEREISVGNKIWTVITYNTVFGGKPDKTILILDNIFDTVLGKAVFRIVF